jgi:hypothetical protein
MLPAVAEISEKHCAHTESVTRGDLAQKSPSLIGAAECFLPLQVMVVIYGCQIGQETRNWAQMRSALV